MNYLESTYLARIFDFGILHMELNTFLYTLSLILVVMFFLNKLLFQPVLRTLENRGKLESSLGKSTEDRHKEIERMTEAYQESLVKVREEVAKVRAESHKAIQTEVEGILSQARNEAQADFDKAMEDLNQQMETVRGELSATAQALAEQATNRIMGA